MRSGSIQNPAKVTCALSKDLSQVVVTVDTGINEKTAPPGSVAVAIQHAGAAPPLHHTAPDHPPP